MKTLLASIVLLASLPLPVFASSLVPKATASELAIADTYIAKSAPTSSYGNASILLARRYTNNSTSGLHKMVLFAFDFTDSKYVGQEITKAELKFTVNKTHATHRTIRILPYTDWSEGSANYNTFKHTNAGPSLLPFEYPIVATFSATAANVTINLTEELKGLFGHKFVIAVEDQGGYELGIYSKENTNGKGKPRIDLTYQSSTAPGTPSGQALTPTAVPMSAKEIIGSLRGLYSWMGNDGKFNPNSEPAVDRYKRFEWKTLEPLKGVYNFTAIDAEISRLKPGQKFAFRIRAMIDSNNALPSYMQVSPYTFSCNNQKIPNWNNAEYLERSRLLMQKLGEKYNNSGKIAWIDIGMYGKFGEGHMHNMPSTCMATSATLRKIIDQHVQYFSNIQLIMPYGNDEAPYALNTVKSNNYGPIGVRSDTIGEQQLTFMGSATQSKTLLTALISNWKTAPFITEFVGIARINKAAGNKMATLEAKAWHFSALGNGNTHEWKNLTAQEKADFDTLAKTLGYRYQPSRVTFNGTVAGGSAFKIITDWSNVGVTPTYEPWKVSYILRRSGSTTNAATFTSAIDMRTVLPTTNAITGVDTPRRFTDNFTMPGSLQGNYDVFVIIEDSRSGYKRLPLSLALSGRNGKGEYKLGTISVQ